MEKQSKPAGVYMGQIDHFPPPLPLRNPIFIPQHVQQGGGERGGAEAPTWVVQKNQK